MKVRTSVLKGFALLALSTFTFAACDEKTETPPVVQPVEVSVTPQSITLQQGQTAPLVAIVNNAANTNVTWRTTTPSVATVSASGVVTAVAPGTAVITAVSVQDTTKRAAAAVTVTGSGPAVPVAIEVVPDQATIAPTGTVQLVSLITGTSNQAVTYRTSAASVATVSTTGLVTGVAAGTAVITAIAQADTTKRDVSVITVSAVSGPGVTISITPTQGSVSVGGTQQFVGLVQGSTNQGVTYRSSTPAVATINATTGVATGVAPGTTVITAIANADTTRRATATLTVQPLAPPPSVSIQSVTPIGPNNTVAGQITAVANVSADVSHDVRRVEFRIDGQAVCTQTFSQPLGTTQGVAQISCPINTAELDASGNPRFPNGPRTLTVVAINGAGTVVAQATYPTLNFANTNTIGGTVTFTNSAIGTDGFLWNRGDATIRVTPQLFTGGTLAAVTVNLDIGCDGGNDAQLTANQANAYTVTFTRGTDAAPGPLYGVASPNVCFTLGQAQTTTGQPLTFAPTGTVFSPTPLAAGTNQTYRIDNVAPAPPSGDVTRGDQVGGIGFPNGRTWVGSGFNFTVADAGAPAANIAAATVTGVRDNPPCFNDAGTVDITAFPRCTLGSGVVATNVSFFAVPTAEVTTANTPENNAALIAGRTAVTSSAQLQNTASDQALTLFVRIRDAVGNERVFRGGTFGVDLENPTVSFITSDVGSPINNHINPQVNASGGRICTVAGGAPNTLANPYGCLVADAGAGGPLLFRFSASDSVSDVPNNPIQVRLTRTFGSGTIQCYNAQTKAIINDPISGNPVTAPCPYVTINGFQFDMTGLPEGWWRVEARVFDNAGNISNLLDRQVLIDVTDPIVTVTTVAGNVNPNPTSVTVTGLASDSVGLRATDIRLAFAGLPTPAGATTNTVPITMWDAFGTMTAASRVLNRNVNASGPVFRSIQDGVGGAVYQLSGAGIGAWDMARNFAEATGGAPAGVAVGAAIPVITGWALATTTTTHNNVSRQVADPAWGFAIGNGIGTTVTLQATATGPVGTFERPFATVYYYRIDTNNGTVQLIASTSSTSITETTDRTYTYTTTASNATPQQAGTLRYFAIGVTQDGQAMRTPITTVRTNQGAFQTGS